MLVTAFALALYVVPASAAILGPGTAFTPGSSYLALGDSVTFGYLENTVVPTPPYHEPGLLSRVPRAPGHGAARQGRQPVLPRRDVGEPDQRQGPEQRLRERAAQCDRIPNAVSPACQIQRLPARLRGQVPAQSHQRPPRLADDRLQRLLPLPGDDQGLVPGRLRAEAGAGQDHSQRAHDRVGDPQPGPLPRSAHHRPLLLAQLRRRR